MCGYITWKSIKVADYIYHCVAISRGKLLKLQSIYMHCVAISRGKVLKLRSIYIIVWLYHVKKY